MTRIAAADDNALATHRELFEFLIETGGMVPNNFHVLARKPGLLEAVLQLGRLVMMDEGSLDRSLRWLVGYVVSRAAGCRYCWAHTARNAVKRAGVSAEKVEAAFEFRTSPLFDAGERAALELAAAAGVLPNAATEDHFRELKQHFDDDQIVEIVAVIALFGWFNRWNDTMATALEDDPLQFATRHLGEDGWSPGKHA